MTEERRVAPRFKRQLQVSIGELRLETTNVSESGLQLVCPELWLRRLKRAMDNERIDLVIRVGADLDTKVRGRVAYISEAGDEYLIGVAFERFDGDGEAAWKALCR
mgnify:CR=1 FL=1